MSYPFPPAGGAGGGTPAAAPAASSSSAAADPPPFGRHTTLQQQQQQLLEQQQQAAAAATAAAAAPKPLDRAQSRAALLQGQQQLLQQQPLQQQQQQPHFQQFHPQQQQQQQQEPATHRTVQFQDQQQQQQLLSQHSQSVVYGLAAPQPGPDPEGLDQSADPNAGFRGAGGARPPGATGAAGEEGGEDAWRAHPSLQQNLPESVYYSKDPPSNLQICVRLRRQPEDAGLIGRPQTEKQLAWARKQEQLRQEAAARATATAGNTSAGTAAAAAAAGMSADGSAHYDLGNDDLDDDGLSRRNLSPESSSASSPGMVVTQLFSWQQKVWSPAELLLAASGAKSSSSYSDGALAMLRATYPGEEARVAAARFIASQPEGMMLSSMRDHDRYVDPEELHKHVLTSSVRANKHAQGQDAVDDLTPLARALVLAPHAAHASHSHLTRDLRATPFHILATVNLPVGAPEAVRLTRAEGDELSGEEKRAPRVVRSFQKQLVRLRVSDSEAQVRLEMRPGFSPPIKDPSRFDHAEWYAFTTPGGDVYRYRIENYSAIQAEEMAAATAKAHSLAATLNPASVSREERERARQLETEQARLEAEVARLAAHEMHVQVSRSGRDFEAPPATRGYEHWQVYGEITKLTHFQDEELSVAYQLDLRTPHPLDQSAADALSSLQTDAQKSKRGPVLSSPWTASPDSLLEAVSRSSRAVWAEGDVAGEARHRAAYVSAQLEWKLRTKSGPFLAPILYVHVYALNRWGMRSVVGYGFAHLPREPGCHELVLHTWQPRGSVREQLDRFFLGVAHPLDDVRNAGVPTPERLALSHGVINRLGGPVLEPSGRVHLRLEMAQIVCPEDLPDSVRHSLALSRAGQDGAAAQVAAAVRKANEPSEAELQRDREQKEIAALRQRSRAQLGFTRY